MTADLRNGLRTGLIFGIVIIFLVLVGFPITVAQLITGLFGGEAVETGTPASLMITLGLFGFWIGTTKARLAGRDDNTWGHAAVRSLATGLVCGLIFGLLVFFMAMERANKVDLRSYLYQLSPAGIDQYVAGTSLILSNAVYQSLGRLGPLFAALVYVGFFLVTALVGALVGYALGLLHLGEILGRWWGKLRESSGRLPAVEVARRSPITRYVLFLLLLLAVILIPPQLSKYWNFILGTIGIYVLIGLGLNIVVGFAGLLDLGYVAFYAVGAYTVGLLTAPAPHHLLWNFWVALPIGILLAATAGVLLGVPVLRLRGDYLAIVTLGFGEIIRILSKSDALTWFTGGPQGVPTIATPSLFGISLSDERSFLYLIFIGIVLLIFIIDRLQHSRVGRAWVAIREDETVAQAMGINTLYYKLLAFGIGAACAGMGGVLFASRNGFTGPEDFTFMVSINVLSLVIVGGMGSVPGVILGAFVLKGMPEILRELEQFRILAFGALLVAMMILRPQGIWPSAQRRLEMHLKDEELTEELETQPSGEGTK